MMDELFDFWLAKKVDNFLKEGFDIEQTKTMLNLLYSDLSDCIDDKNIVNCIKRKMVRTVEIFMIGEKQ